MTAQTNIEAPCGCSKPASHRLADFNSDEWLCEPPAWFRDPTACPSWCIRDHSQGVAEGNTLAECLPHTNSGAGCWLPDLHHPLDGRLLRAGGHGWEMYAELTPSPRSGTGLHKEPVVRLELAYHGKSVAAPLTRGEARTLAAQLIQQADVLDLA